MVRAIVAIFLICSSVLLWIVFMAATNPGKFARGEAGLFEIDGGLATVAISVLVVGIMVLVPPRK